MLACTLIITTLHFQSGLISLVTPASHSSQLVLLLQSSILPDSSLLTWQTSQALLATWYQCVCTRYGLVLVCYSSLYISYKNMYIQGWYIYVVCTSNVYHCICKSWTCIPLRACTTTAQMEWICLYMVYPCIYRYILVHLCIHHVHTCIYNGIQYTYQHIQCTCRYILCL